MLKLIKYLKPYSVWIALIFILLFGQAMADLSLPAFMSDIVNVGIQQHGIENAVPQVIRASEFSKIALFMTAPEKAQVLGDYTLLDRNALSAADYANYVKKYPDLANEPVYLRNATDKAQLQELDAIFSKYIPVVATIEQAGLAGFGVQLPAGADPFVALSQLPADQFDAIRVKIDQNIGAIPPTMLKQYATTYLYEEYKTIGTKVGSIQTGYMLKIGSLMLLLTLAGTAASVVVGFVSARIAGGLGRDLRRRLFVRVESFSNTEFNKFSTASLITRSTNDITQIQMMMVMLFRLVFYAPILAIGGIIRVTGSDESMIWIIAAAVGVMLTMMLFMFIVAIPKFETLQRLTDKLNLVTREMLTGLMVIRAFNTQEHEEGKFDKANVDLTKTNLFVNRLLVFLMPVMMLVMNGVMLLIIWVGSHQIDAGTTQVGSMMAFMQYAMQIIMAFLMISVVFVMVPRASVSAKRVSEVLEIEPVIKDPEKPLQYNGDAKGLVQFQDVSFRYPGAEDEVLQHITFAARPGETTAVIGSTGSGKSTLVDLIPRFYDVTSGRVLVDGLDVREVTQHNLREKIGYISQKAILFSGSIESNIKYGNENATAEEVAKYADIAQASEFITTSEKGFETEVSQGGTNLSGGQKQRLAIARALARQPEIYIFDDSLSALDFKTEAALRRSLKKETGGSTVLIVTQRVSTVMGAEQIVVLDKGSIAGVGTHKDLMANCAVYQEIASSQLTREELAS
jgi:ATP-binding cassette, subfamily B, multidrug efflux pump